MAIKKKTILTDNIPQQPLTTPVLLNNISIPFALGYPANVTFPNVTQPAGFARPTQSKGFDITVTDLTKPNPIYLNDLNGIFNLYSGALNDLCSGIPIQYDPTYITNRQAYNNQTPAPTPIPVGYPLDAILFSYPNNAWYRSLSANNQDTTLNSTTIPPTSTVWQKITNNILVQQGRLTGSQGFPYGDTNQSGSPTLYFTPTEQGNLISLYNGTSWVTQSLPTTDLQLIVSTLNGNFDIYVANTTTGLVLINNAWTNSTPSAPTGRVKLNGKWVNNIAVGGIPQYQALLVGSINVTGGVVQSWNGNRSIWNLYNQVSLGLLASQGSINENNLGVTPTWTYGQGTYRSQQGNTTAGQGNFVFLTDPLYNKKFTCSYSGGIYLNNTGQFGIVGIALGTTLTPLVNFSAGVFPGSTFFPATAINYVPFNASYSYQFNNSNTTTLPTGLNTIQKIEYGGTDSASPPRYTGFSDNSGLTSEYWG